MKITLTTRPLQYAQSKKIDKYIEIVGSSNPRLNAMATDASLSLQSVLGKHYSRVGITLVDNITDLELLAAKKPDLVILGMKLVLLDPSKSYDESPKVWLSDYLTERGINFTGSDTAALTLEFDKPVAKQAVIDAGLESSAYFISSINHPVFKHSLRFPLFVKPSNRGDSKGIDENSVVHTQEALEAKILSIHNDYSSDAIAEEYLPGREFSVAVIKHPRLEKFLAMPIEITSPTDKNGNNFLSESVKESDSEKVMPVTDAKLKKELNDLAVSVFKALGSRDYGRIDLRLNTSGAPSFIEANLMPGLSNHGYLLRCFYMNEKIGYESMILSIVSLALERASSTLLARIPTVPSVGFKEIVAPELIGTGLVI